MNILLRKPLKINEKYGRCFAEWRRFRWIEKIVRKLWDYFSCDYIFSDTIFVARDVSVSGVLEAIEKIRSDYIHCNRREVSHVILGFRQFELMTGECIDRYGPFYFDGGSIDVLLNDRCRMYRGMKIIVVPTFDGICVVPEGMINDRN